MIQRPAFEVEPSPELTRRDIEALLRRPFEGAASLRLGRRGKRGTWHARVEFAGSEHLEVGEIFDLAHLFGEVTGGSAVPVFDAEGPAPPDPHPDREWHLREARFPQGGAVSGEGVVIAHPDTGYTNHAELEVSSDRYRERAGTDFLDGGLPKAAKGTVFYGHGTAIGSVLMSGRSGGPDDVIGAAPRATLVPYRVTTTVALWRRKYRRNLARAIEAAIHHRDHPADVISISMGWLWGHRKLTAALRAAEDNGVIVVAAAAQLAKWMPGLPWVAFPGRYPSVVCAAASDRRNEPCFWSARGRAVDITAPGEKIWRAVWKGSTAAAGPSHGTSYATALTAGAAALWLQKYKGHPQLRDRSLRPRFFRAALAKSAGILSGTPDPDKWGAGLLNVQDLLGLGPDELTPQPRLTPDLRRVDELGALLQDVAPGTPWRSALPALLDAEYEVDDLDKFIEAHGQEFAAHAEATPGVRAALEDRWKDLTALDPRPEKHFVPAAPLIPGASRALARRRRR